MTEIQYASEELIKKLDELNIDQLLKLKIMLYIHKSLESEETLDENCKVLDMNRRNHERKKFERIKVLASKKARIL